MPLRRVVRWGGWGSRSGSGGSALLGGVSRGTVSSPRLHAWAGGARPSPASSLVWGLWRRRRRVPPAVAPVSEGFAQGRGEPVVGIRIRDAKHRPSLQKGRPRWFPVGPRHPNHRPEDPLVVLWGRSLRQGPLPFPPVPPEENGIKRAGSSSPWWSPSRPSSATRTPPPPGGGPRLPGGLGPRPSPGPRAGHPLPPAPASPAVPVPAAPALRPAPPPPEQQPSAPAPLSAQGGLAGAGVGGVGGG